LIKEYSVKQFVFLLAACVCPHGFYSAASADESRSADESQPIALATDEIVQQKEITARSAVADDAAVKSEVSITATVNETEESLDKNAGDAAVDGADSAPDTEVLAVPSRKQIVIHLGGNADENSAFATIVDDSQAKVQMNGKIVVIGPDGKRQEFAISGNEAGKVFKFVTGGEATGNADQQASHIDSVVRILKRHDASGTASEDESASEARVAIGVQCEDVPDALRSHLDLGEMGIMVVHVREQSPASEAGLLKFDIIRQIGDTDVTKTDDLVSSVASSEGKELTFSIIRHGEPMKIAVTPRKMQFLVIFAPAQTEFHLGDVSQDTGHLPGNPAWQSLSESVRKQVEGQIGIQNSLRKFHPGIVIEQRMPSNEKDMQRLIEHARKLAEDSGRVAQIRTQKAFEAVESGTHDEVAASVEALRDQVRAMEQKLEQFEQRLAAEGDDKK